MKNIFSRDKSEERIAPAATQARTLDYSRDPILLGVDTGNSGTKTAKTAFNSSLISLVDEPGFMPEDATDLIKTGDMYYQLGDARVSYQEDKTQENEYLVLTQIAIAKELKARNLGPRQNIALAVGLPPGHLYDKKLRTSYRKYFFGADNGHFEYRCGDREHIIDIVHVFLTGQGHAAIMTLPRDIIYAPSLIGIDIGGFTDDIIRMANGKMVGTPISSNLGVNRLYRDVRQALRLGFRRDISDAQIDEIIEGDNGFFTQPQVERVLDTVRNHIRSILSEAVESGLDLSSSTVIFMGGGSVLLQKYISEIAREMCGEYKLVTDIKANAQGYEVYFAEEYQKLLDQWHTKNGR